MNVFRRCFPLRTLIPRKCAMAVLPLVVLSGCSQMLSRTAHQTGCEEDEIVITDEHNEMGWSTGTLTWTATCRNKVFHCRRDQRNDGLITHTEWRCVPAAADASK